MQSPSRGNTLKPCGFTKTAGSVWPLQSGIAGRSAADGTLHPDIRAAIGNGVYIFENVIDAGEIDACALTRPT